MKKLSLAIVKFDMKMINRNTYERQNIRNTGQILETEFYDDFIGCSDGMNLIWEATRNERKKKEEFN